MYIKHHSKEKLGAAFIEKQYNSVKAGKAHGKYKYWLIFIQKRLFCYCGAEDLFNNAAVNFIEYWRKIWIISPGTPILSYLLFPKSGTAPTAKLIKPNTELYKQKLFSKIIKSRIIDHNDKCKAKRVKPVEDDLITNYKDIVEDLSWDEEKIELLYFYIEQIPNPWHKLCIKLRLDGLSIKEVGEVLGLTETTVKSYIRRAKDSLRGLMLPKLKN